MKSDESAGKASHRPCAEKCSSGFHHRSGSHLHGFLCQDRHDLTAIQFGISGPREVTVSSGRLYVELPSEARQRERGGGEQTDQEGILQRSPSKHSVALLQLYDLRAKGSAARLLCTEG